MSASSPDTLQAKEVHLCAYKARKTQVPPVPLHWIFERDGHSKYHGHFCWRPFTHSLYHLFCVIGLGHASLHAVWEECYEGCSDRDWEHFRDELRERLEHTNLVVRSPSITVFLVVTTFHDLGWFTHFCDGSILHYRPPCGREVVALYEYSPLLCPHFVCQFCPWGSGDRVCYRICDP